MEQVLTLAGLIALGWKLVDFGKYLTNKAWNDALTQLEVWVVGVILVFLASAAALPIDIGGQTIEAMNAARKVLVGLSLLSIASVGFDGVKAVDNNDTAAKPSLLPPNKATCESLRPLWSPILFAALPRLVSHLGLPLVAWRHPL